MADKTGLEKQEDEVKDVLFGKPQGIGGVDKSMLEMTDTNRLIFDSRQSELEIACILLHRALYETDNRKPVYKRVHEPATDTWHMEAVTKDAWRWVKDVNYLVRSNQLTIKGYSRAQHLRQAASQSPVAVEEEQQSFWQRLFGR